MKRLLPISFAIFFCITKSFGQNSQQREIDAFVSETGAVATTDQATHSINFLRFPIGKALNLEGNSPTQKAFAFLSKYSGLFAKTPFKDEYQVKESKKDIYGLDHVTFQQFYKGIPVFDGLLKFHFNKEGGLSSVNGNFIIAENLNINPSVSKDEAAQIAQQTVSKQKSGEVSAPLKVSKSTLLVFQKGLAQGYRGPLHLVYEIEVRNDADVREFLFIDSHKKNLVEQFTGMHSIDRKLYETSVSAQNLKWQDADGIGGAKYAALDKWQKSEVESAGHIYNLMKNAFGFDSYNNAGATMVTINNNPQIACPNANWNGLTANYCTGTATDDVVAHEWGHAYTEYTSGLIYAWQAGALNEAYSDIWGETVDQLNGYFDNGESNAVRTGCANSARWKLGEQASAFGGAIRDMWDPTCNGNPGKVSDPQYNCLGYDNGGVHNNSGVINHAFSLLVDGGSYNGQNITGLGLTKAAHIFWRAQALYNTSTTDFGAQADMLEAALVDLAGIDLPKLSTNGQSGPSGIKILYSDLAQLIKVVNAVEMKSNGCSLNPNSKPLFETLTPLCQGGLPGNAIYYENFENGLGGWTVSNSGVHPTWTSRNWSLNDNAPGGRSGKVITAGGFQGGDCFGNLQDGLMSLISPVINIPVGKAGPFYLSFEHFVSLELDADGGNLQYKLPNSPWLDVPKSAFIGNAYNTTLWNDNPLNGQDCFSGGDGGSLTSHWGESRINLTDIGALSGKTIQFRFNLGSNGCGAWAGWFIDDVKVYSCTSPTVQFETSETNVNEAEANIQSVSPNNCLPYIEKKVTVKINQAPSKPALVTLNVSGTASSGIGNDYSITPNSFTLQAGALSKDILVRIYDDGVQENTETLTLSYSLSNPAGGNASPETFHQQHTIVIDDDDRLPQTSTVNVFDENFNAGIPNGWKTPDGANFPESWDVVDYKNAQALDPAGTPYLYVNSSWGFQDPNLLERTIETRPFNSLKAKSLSISFIEFYFPSEGINIFNEQATVDVWDGTAWHTILTQNQTTGMSGQNWDQPASRNISIPLAYRNAAMKIRFRYLADWNGWWAIDNFKVMATYEKEIQNTVSASADAHYLGPNSTVYFRDPATDRLIAKIKNLTDHDYGCTSVQIDRAGIDETTWVGSKKISKKTFKVSPTNDNPSGNYEITLYYNASELAGFNGNKIKSMGQSQGSILQAMVATSLTAPVQMTMFNNDFAYTSTFNSGFGGFGLSDAPAGEALPVIISRFEGKHSSEGNILNWETSEEVRNDHFDIERSADARIFVKIGEVAGAGNSKSQKTYSFIDNDWIGDAVYYRLKQIDTNGSITFSRIIVIDPQSKKKLLFYPNPVQSWLNLEIPEREVKRIIVTNTLGHVVIRQEQVSVEEGKLRLDLSNLMTGIYQIVIQTEDTAYHCSVVKVTE